MVFKILLFGEIGGVFQEEAAGVIVEAVEVLGEVFEGGGQVQAVLVLVQAVVILVGDPEAALMIELGGEHFGLIGFRSQGSG